MSGESRNTRKLLVKSENNWKKTINFIIQHILEKSHTKM